MYIQIDVIAVLLLLYYCSKCYRLVDTCRHRETYEHRVQQQSEYRGGGEKKASSSRNQQRSTSDLPRARHGPHAPITIPQPLLLLPTADDKEFLSSASSSETHSPQIETKDQTSATCSESRSHHEPHQRRAVSLVEVVVMRTANKRQQCDNYGRLTS